MRRAVVLGLAETMLLWALVEWLLAKLRTPQMVDADRAFWRWHRETTWARFIYEIVSGYGAGELDHWYADAPAEQKTRYRREHAA